MSTIIDKFASVGTALPTTTKGGKLFFLIDLVTPSNSKLYASFGANAWTQIANNAGSVATVASVFARTGAVAAAANDYTFDQIGAGINLNKITIGATGELVSAVKAEPADATLGNSQFTLWLTDTHGSAVLNIKAKDASGTVVKATVALS